MSPWDKLLERPQSGHFVQLYQADDKALIYNVGRYMWEGLRRGEGALAIITPEHQDLLSRHLDHIGADLAELFGNGQLVFCDAQEILSQFMTRGQPDWQSFESIIRTLMRRVHPQGDVDGFRAYGEMVGILWKMRQFAAAIRLEQLWNRLLEQSSFSLYCAYAIDIFGNDFRVADLDSVLCAHTHLVPAQVDGTLETALNRAMDEILGTKVHSLRDLIKANYRPGWAVMPTAESIVIWLRRNQPKRAGEVIERARHHYCLMMYPAGVPQSAHLVHAAGIEDEDAIVAHGAVN